MTKILDADSLSRTCKTLARRDPVLGEVVSRLGPPPLWARPPGFGTLLLIILEQQVSLASARAVYRKLRGLTPRPSAKNFLQLSDTQLQRCGFSRQKMRYGRDLAERIRSRQLSLTQLATLPDSEVHTQLCTVCGIGSWTANVYLIMALQRPDVWPPGDLALIAGVRDLYTLPSSMKGGEVDAFAERWQPHRSVAARIVWSHYLARQGKKSVKNKG